MRKAMMMVVLGLALVTVAHAEDTENHQTAVSPEAAVVVQTEAPKEAPKAEPKEEFAGFTMIKFFQKSVEAVNSCTKTHGLPGGDSIRIAAY